MCGIFENLDRAQSNILDVQFWIIPLTPCLLITHLDIRESPSQFENRIMPRVYVITRSTMYKKLHFVSPNLRVKN